MNLKKAQTKPARQTAATLDALKITKRNCDDGTDEIEKNEED